MSWESRLLEVFEDLEQQAAGLYLAERDAEVEELRVSEFATVTLASRCRAAVGREVSLQLLGGTRLHARLIRAGALWVVLHEQQGAWLVPLDAVARVSGATRDSVHESTWTVADRLPLRALLRRVTDEAPDCRVYLRDGECHEVTMTRVGADFVELRSSSGRGEELLPIGALAAVRWRAR